jgi:hypothetical protein
VSGHGEPKVRTSRLEQLVYTYPVGRIAGDIGVFDSKVSIVVDGPSKLCELEGRGIVFGQ